MRILTLALLACCGIFSGLQAQVVINEFSASNVNTLADAFGEYEDWIELHNTGTSAADLSGYHLSDRYNNPQKWAFPAGTVLQAGGFLRVFASSRNTLAAGQLHANFKITQTRNEYVVFSDPDGVILDSYHITQPTQTNHSWGRHPSTGNWQVYTNPTPGSANGANAFNGYAPIPIFSAPAGFYDAPLSLSLFGPVGSTIRYTLDGQEPTAASTLYTGPIDISATTVVRARIYSNDSELLPGFIQTNTYFINEEHTLPVISVAGTQLQQLLNGQQNQPVGALEFFKEGQLIDEAVGQFNKHGNDSWAYAQRGVDYITRDQYGYAAEIEDQIFETKDRDGFQRLILKAAANDNYPFQNGGAHIRDAYVHHLSQLAGLELDERSYEPCILYVNGQYWGVYEIREKVDDSDFTNYYFDQDEFDIDFIKTWGATWQEYGTWNEWYPLHDFIVNNDMSDPANYAYADERLDMLSLIDYMVINTHTVCKDWLNWNTAWWRGRNPEGDKLKWRYTLWDLDATFGHYINYTSIPNTTPTADPCDNETYPPSSDPQGHVDLIISLMENETFHSLYVNRYADLLNSFFSCEYMIDLLDSLVARIEPEMPRQIQKWGGTMAQWQNNVQALRNFINERCTHIDGGIVDCYEVTGPFPVKVSIVPEDSPNEVKVNTFVPQAFPFEGEYFGETTLEFQALPDVEWEFSHWEVANHPFSPDQFAEAITLSLMEDEEVIAYFQPAIPCALPGNIQVETTQTTAAISWEGPFNYLSYGVRWRAVGSDTWSEVTSLFPEITLTGLQPCTDYDLELGTICGFATSDLVDAQFSTDCLNAANEKPLRITAFQIYPNPARNQIHLEFDLMTAGDTGITVRDATGKLVWQQTPGAMPPGRHRQALAGSESWPAGVYFVYLQMEKEVAVRKAVKK